MNLFIGQLRERLTGRLAKRNIHTALPMEYCTGNQSIRQNYVHKQLPILSPSNEVQNLPRPTSSCMFKEDPPPYCTHLEGKMAILNGENGLFWDFHPNI